MKKIFIFAALIATFCLTSCKSTEEVDTSIELASPKPTVTTKLATVTVKWAAIPKAAGYAYRVGESGEFTEIEAAKTSVTVSSLSKGDYNFYIYAVGNLDHTTDSKVRQISFSVDPMLPAPEVSFKVGAESGTAVMSWDAVEGAVGYGYKFNSDADWTMVDDQVLTVTKTGLDSEADNTFYIYAVGEDPYSQDSPQTTLPFKLLDTSEGVWVKTDKGGLTELTAAEGIYTATVTCGATENFVVMIENTTYGFTAFTGNGGVGTVNHLKASAPFYNGGVYYVRESVGRMTSEGTLNKFWVNTGVAGSFSIKIDLTNADAIPRYYIKWDETIDSKIVLAQYFDLFSYGGDWVNYFKGTASGTTGTGKDAATDNCDGTEDGTQGILAGTGLGKNIASSADASPAYIANRNLTGWDITNGFEFPGYIRLSNSKSGTTNLYGEMTTPKLSALTAATNVTLTFDALRFASTEDIKVAIIGGGTFAAVKVRVEGSGSEGSIAPAADNMSFAITSAHTPKHANSVAPKPWSNFTVSISGATANTQIKWDCTTASTSSEGRICFDNIIVKKN